LNMFGVGKYSKVKLFIIADRSGTRSLFLDTATRKGDKKTGTEWYRLKKLKENMRPIEFKHIVQNPKGAFAVVYSPAKSEFYPMEITDTYRSMMEVQVPVMEEYTEEVKVPDKRMKEGFKIIRQPAQRQKIDKEGKPMFTTQTVEVRGLLEPVNEDQKAFLITEMERAQMRHGKQGFWEKFGSLLSVLMCGVALALVFLFWAEAAKVVLGQTAAMAGMLEQIANILSGVKTLVPG